MFLKGDFYRFFVQLLNCSGRDNVLFTLSKGFGCTVPELKKALLHIDLEHIFTANSHIPKTANQLLFDHTVTSFTKSDEVTSVFWFHGSWRDNGHDVYA